MKLTGRNALFGVLGLSLLVGCSGLLRQLIAFSLKNDYGSHILIIPFISVALIYLNRTRIFARLGYSIVAGILVLCLGAALSLVYWTANFGLSQSDYLSVITASNVTLFLGGFLLFYGASTFRTALFPLMFLYFMVPVPVVLLNPLISFLQRGSTEILNNLFILTGTPFHREGFVFALPKITIQVAEQCSGIRSSIALLITSLLAGYMFLRTGRNKTVLALVVFPVSMFKNAVRIATLSLLAVHVDQRILTSSLHREGGIPFFALALVFLLPVLVLLRKNEMRGLKPQVRGRESPGVLAPRV